MKYKGLAEFSHQQSEKVGVLITNLGTPDEPSKGALKKYLKQFLSDPRVVEVPKAIWWFVLNGVILNFRPKRSAHAYQQVWTEQGSPLRVHTQARADKLRAQLTLQWGDDICVEYAMRYGQPAIEHTIEKMLEQGVRKLLVVPLYPQYSGSTTGSTFDAIAADFTQRRFLPELRFVNHYCDFEPYITALVESIKSHWQRHGQAEKLLFSYHGVPKRYLKNGDPYHCQCLKTTRLIVERLGLTEDQYLTCFQSRFGREPWLMPYTDETLKQLPNQGVSSVQVICPGFSADCLETIEEIGMENRDYFLQAGGTRYEYIPALNSEQAHIKALTELVSQNLQGWQQPQQTGTQRQAAYNACPHNKN